MPIKFSELPGKNINQVSNIVGLFTDNLSETGESNCIINAGDFAKNSELAELNTTVAALNTRVTNNDTNAVHRNGDETISGNKTFNNSIKSTIKDKIVPNNAFSVSMGQEQSNDGWSDLIGLYDTTNSCRCATIRAYDRPDKHGILIGANDFNNSNPNGIEVSYDSSNNLTATAPTPTAGDNSTKIATTAWVNSYLSTILNNLYPIGSVYIGTQNKNTCPIASLITGSTWVLVSSGKALWTGTGLNGNTTIDAGLPDIYAKGFMGDAGAEGGNYKKFREQGEGALRYIGNTYYGSRGGIDNDNCTGEFKASLYNSIYGKSTTVQPPAYVVNVWRRIA